MDCAVTECTKPVQARGWCPAHYQKWRKYGHPLGSHTFENQKPCSFEDCTKLVTAKGLCPQHYMRRRTHGDPSIILTDRGTPLEYRFLKRVHKTEDCWLWTGFLNHGGYGRFAISHTTSVQAHRWAYEHWVALIPDGLTIDHLCHVRRCVNPEHLEPVTIQENLRRRK